MFKLFLIYSKPDLSLRLNSWDYTSRGVYSLIFILFSSRGGSPPPPFSVCMARLSDKTSPERLSFQLSETTL